MSKLSVQAWVAIAVFAFAWESGAQQGTPEGYIQILPRGRIAAIDSPTFVSAAEAALPSDAWVLGLVLDGEARDYSLNLLNRHEIVNDRVSGRAIAAVW